MGYAVGPNFQRPAAPKVVRYTPGPSPEQTASIDVKGGEAMTEQFDLSSLQLPQELPVSLPCKLVEQRPDVRSAEEQMHSAAAQIGVAVANRLPNISLSADYGTSATAISQLFSPGTGFWVLAANAAQPIFQGGRCCTGSGPPRQPSTRRRRTTAARCLPLSRTWPMCSRPSKATPRPSRRP
jgi:hypothetical protein